ncbi:MAG: response regulator [Planctomycetaceae bacterium]
MSPLRSIICELAGPSADWRAGRTIMDKKQLIERLMATFLGELGEHVRALNEELMALEKGPEGPGRAERFKVLFREAHNLKGAARSVGVGLIEDACHRLETILAAARDGPTALGPDLFALLFATADALEEAGMRLREQQDLSDSPLAALLPRLERAAGGMVPAPGPARVRAPAPPPVLPPLVAETAPSARPNAPADAAPAPGPSPASLPSATLPESERPPGGAAFVRVPAEKLDAMLTRSGELLVARRRVESRIEELAALRDEWSSLIKAWKRSLPREGGAGPGAAPPARATRSLARFGDRLDRLEEDFERLSLALASDRRQLARAAGLLDEEVRRVRMLPFAEACQGLERIVRDVARAEEKPVDLVVEGNGVELDRSVLEGLKDPLVHLVRNAVDHGIEPPEARRAAGKPPAGRVTITAALRGAQVEVVVADDGKGLDLDALRQQARRRGYNEPSSARDLHDLIFLPGFSTAPMITNISGRGVGLDVVRSRLEVLHGTVEVTSEAGHGTRFRLAVPLTLTTLRALQFRAGGQTFALSSANVQRLVRIDPSDLRMIEGREMLATGGPPLPIASLAEVLGLPAQESEGTGGKLLGLIVVVGDRRMAFVVDELLIEQEIIVKALGDRIRRVRNVSGATILPTGRIALVLNAASLVRHALSRASGMSVVSRRPAEAATAPARRRLLVVDDSVTTRTLEKSILEAAGYEVATAVDGEAGWRLLQERGTDLLISDIEMPRMDGFMLTEAVRASSRFADLPVILFTSQANERDRVRGAEVGADAYIVKGAFDQKELLDTIAQLL